MVIIVYEDSKTDYYLLLDNNFYLFIFHIFNVFGDTFGNI